MAQYHIREDESEMDNVMQTDTEIDLEDNNSDDGVTRRIVQALAAHPLSSCNPPPRELPDLLDSLIANDSRLREQAVRIEKVGEGLTRRIVNLKQRVQQLQAANAHLKKDVQTADPNKASEVSKERRLFETQERVLQTMCLQTAFIHYTFLHKIKGMTLSTLKSQNDILNEFLGQRHAHPGIGIADSTKMLCVPGCEWYQKHGPYEWSKKPYTNSWWEEMNHTDWDWLRIKEHISTAVSVGGGKAIATYDTMQANSMKFIPSWFWAEDFETWTLHGETETVENTEGDPEDKIVIKVRFNKSTAQIQQETANRTKETNKARTGKGDAETDSNHPSTSDGTISIDKVGETVIDERFVFDGIASMAGGDKGGSQQIRWLVWWGYEKWHTALVQRRMRKAGVK